jgi:hypothetical protein
MGVQWNLFKFCECNVFTVQDSGNKNGTGYRILSEQAKVYG